MTLILVDKERLLAEAKQAVKNLQKSREDKAAEDAVTLRKRVNWWRSWFPWRSPMTFKESHTIVINRDIPRLKWYAGESILNMLITCATYTVTDNMYVEQDHLIVLLHWLGDE